MNIYYCLQIIQHYNTEVQTCYRHCPIIQCWMRTSDGSHIRAQKDHKLGCFLLLLQRTLLFLARVPRARAEVAVPASLCSVTWPECHYMTDRACSAMKLV